MIKDISLTWRLRPLGQVAHWLMWRDAGILALDQSLLVLWIAGSWDPPAFDMRNGRCRPVVSSLKGLGYLGASGLVTNEGGTYMRGGLLLVHAAYNIAA